MPSVIVKLSSSDARAWSHNQPVWLDESGDIARGVTKEEQHAISRALQQATKINQSFRSELVLHPLSQTGRRSPSSAQRRVGPPPKLDVAFEVTHVGESRVVTVWNGTRRYATGREVLAARLLADHGECVLHGRNGKCIGVLRDPLIRERVAPTGRRVQWSCNPADPRRHDGVRDERTRALGFDTRRSDANKPPKRRRLIANHRTNVRAAARRAEAVRAEAMGPALRSAPIAPRPAPERAPIPERAAISPRHCPNDCRGQRGGHAWTHADTAAPLGPVDHHPLCHHAKAWAKTQDTVVVTDVLFDLQAGVVRRPAFEEEIAEANASEAATGARTVTLADRLYAVLSPADAERAALEAQTHGQSPDAGEPSEGDAASAPVGPSSADDRGAWPSLDDLRPSHRPTHRDAVTARDYLLRSPGGGAAGERA